MSQGFQCPPPHHYTPLNLLAYFSTVFWARESLGQHSVGERPFVCVHGIYVGSPLGWALSWMGHGEAQAPRLSWDRCRLVGALTESACSQRHHQSSCQRRDERRLRWCSQNGMNMHDNHFNFNFAGFWPLVVLLRLLSLVYFSTSPWG